MRYMMMVKSTKESEAGLPPNPEMVAAVNKLSEDLAKRGVLISAGGLLPTSQATRIHVSNGKTSVTDGPFAETKELVGGFAILNLSSKEEAIKLGRDFMQLHADILGASYEGEMEIRPMFD